MPLSDDHHHILDYLAQYRSRTPRQVSDACGFTDELTTLLLEELDHSGYIKMTRAGNQRGILCVGITQKGRILVGRAAMAKTKG